MLARFKNTLIHNDIQTIAKELGLKVTYRKYRMWHQVPFIGNTAMVVDEVEERGGHAIISNPSQYPREIDARFIIEAIQSNAISLGRVQIRGFKYGFTPWYGLIGDYPAGFFSHKV